MAQVIIFQLHPIAAKIATVDAAELLANIVFYFDTSFERRGNKFTKKPSGERNITQSNSQDPHEYTIQTKISIKKSPYCPKANRTAIEPTIKDLTQHHSVAMNTAQPVAFSGGVFGRDHTT